MAKWCFFLPWGQDRDSFRETPGRRPSYNRQIDTQWLWYSWRDEDHHHHHHYHHHHHDDWWWWWPCWYCSCGIFSCCYLHCCCCFYIASTTLRTWHWLPTTVQPPQPSLQVFLGCLKERTRLKGIPVGSRRHQKKQPSWICYSHRSMRELPIPKTHKVEGPMLIFQDLSRIFRDSKNMFGSNPGRWFQNMKTHVCTWYLVINSKPYCPLFWG